MNLAADFKFAEESPDLPGNEASILRYVAAINPECTRKEFVAAAIAAGYKANSSANRFRESRAETMELIKEDGQQGVTLEKSGKIIGL